MKKNKLAPWLFSFFFLLFAFFLFCACAGNVKVRSNAAPDFAPVGRLVGGIGRADLTPPPGFPLFGFSVSAKVGRGHRTRLFARAMYLEDAAGQRVALVQCDLGAISALLHRQVAARIVDSTGISADRLLMSATHTHSAPGTYFGTAVYNLLGAPSPGFDPRFLDFLTDRISAAILQAYKTRAPVKLAFGETSISGITRNRSMAAYRTNRAPGLSTREEDAVNKVLTMIRLDRVQGASTKPLGAFSVFAIHGTTIPHDIDLYSGDSHAAAERIFEAKIKKFYTVNDDVIHALVSGTAGDVMPDYREQGFDAAHELGRVIADSAVNLFISLDDDLRSDVKLRCVFTEIDLTRGHSVNGHRLSRRAVYGASSLGGSEEGGPSKLLGREGVRFGLPVGVQTFKKPAFDQFQRAFPVADFPTMMTLQAVQIGDLLLAAIPVELTSEMGRRIRENLLERARQAGLGVNRAAIVCLANQYMSYVTTPEEYSMQQYEGGSNLYGEQTGPFIGQQVAKLIDQMGKSEPSQMKNRWMFAPGLKVCYLRKKKPLTVTRRIKMLSLEEGLTRLTWIDEPPGTLELGNVLVRVESKDEAGAWRLLVKDDLPVDDRGLDLEVRSLGKSRDERGWQWRATWHVACPRPVGTFRFVIFGGHAPSPLVSEPFVFQ
jgi:neutral ceramidase